MMIRDGSGIDDIGAISVRGASGLSAIGMGLIRDADSLETFFSPGAAMTLDVTPEAFGAAASNSAVIVTTTTATVTVTGGTAPYTYAWERTDDTLSPWGITAAAAATTSFRRTGVSPGDYYDATFACTVTDGNGNTATTDDVAVRVENYGGLGGPLP